MTFSTSEGRNSTIQIAGLTLSYTEWPGEKGPLFCVPSLTGHKGTFTSMAQRLAPEYHLFAFDLRGRGDSDKPEEGYGFAYHARDLLHFADALGFETFILIGHSFGATVGIYLASIRPKRVRAIVLMDGGADPKNRVLEAMYPLLRQVGTVYPSVEAYVEAMQAIPYFQPWSQTLERYTQEDVEILPDGAVRSKSSSQAIERDLDIHFYYSMCLHFPQLMCPALFLHPTQGLFGERGHIFTEPEVAAIVSNIPHCHRVDLPDVNHYTMILHDDPPVISPIRTFLSEV